jgi:hypothetical protein
MNVSKWKIPLTLAGLGGVGALLFSSRGRKLIHSTTERINKAPERLVAWNDSAKDELDHIQQAVQALEQSLGTHTAR